MTPLGIAVVLFLALAGLLFGSILLRIACGLVKTEEPTIGQGMLIVGMIWVLVVVANLMLSPTAENAQPRGRPAEPNFGLQVAAFLVGLGISTFTLMGMMRMSFPTAVLVQLAQLYLNAAIILIVAGIGVLAMGLSIPGGLISMGVGGVMMIPVVSAANRGQRSKPAHKLSGASKFRFSRSQDELSLD